MRKNIFIYLLVLSTLACSGLSGRTVFVSTGGNDQNPGTFESPLRTIATGVTLISAGDTCFIRGGNYHESVSVKALKGSLDSPVVIMAYRNEKVVLDGTILIGNDWEEYVRNIWKTNLSKDIWQLFHNDSWMTMARWPDASLTDGSAWDQQGTWVGGDPATPNGLFRMAGTGGDGPGQPDCSLEGALGILNVGSFRTYTRKITEHKKGENELEYDPVPRSGYRSKKHFAYFEGKLEFLDSENEWFYDPETRQLYAWFPGGAGPEEEVRGKVLTYALSFSGSSHIKISGLDFFAATARFDDCRHISLADCNFNYPTYSKRMLGNTGMIRTTAFTCSTDSALTGHIIRNCTFTNTDGCALVVQGDRNILENCLFENIDISCSEIPGIGVSIMFTGRDNIIRRNTIRYCGCSETLSPGVEAIVELNSISHTGMLQSDGAMIHCMKPEQPGVEISYNWCFESVKYGIRFDGKPASRGGLVHHNVVWNVEGGYQLKGDFHRVYNNTGFGGQEKCDFISLSELVYGGNRNSTYINNLGAKMSGHRTFSSRDYPVPGIFHHNWNGFENGKGITTQLKDPVHLDFRPEDGAEIVDAAIPVEGITENYNGESPDIGAYELGDPDYWIPGRKEKLASTPIPPDGSILVQREQDLMWLFPYGTDTCDIYFGESKEGVEKADRSVEEFRSRQKTNIFNAGRLERGRTYFWRIDAVLPGGVRKGKTWSFSVN